MKLLELNLDHLNDSMVKPLQLKTKKVSNQKGFSTFLLGMCLIIAVILFWATSSYLWAVSTPILCYIGGKLGKLFYDIIQLDFHFKL